MSHFSGLVVLTPQYLKKHDLEDSLERYNENLEVPEYSCGEVDDYEKVRFLEYYLKKEGTNLEDFEELLRMELGEEKKNWPEQKERYAELFIEKYPEYFNNFAVMYEKHGYDWNGDRWRLNYITGKWEEYSTYNPDAKWDWYNENGRWSGAIKKKDGDYVNQCSLGEIDWTDFKPEDYEEEERENIFGEKYRPLKEGVKYHFTQSKPPYCLVVDGEYYSIGDMGGCGCTEDKMTPEEWSQKFFELLENLPEDCEAWNIDFHI